MKNVTKISEIILKYENNFNGCLKSGYKDNKEFLNDLIESMNADGASNILRHYRVILKSLNNINSTLEQRKELEGIILILEGQC